MIHLLVGQVFAPCMGAWIETIILVGAARFERAASCSQSRCAARLRYAPTVLDRAYMLFFPSQNLREELLKLLEGISPNHPDLTNLLNTLGKGALEASPIEVDTINYCPTQVCVTQICPTEIGFREVCSAQVGLVEVGPLEVGLI